MGTLIFGVVSVICGLLGAFLASRAADLGMATFGLGLVGFAILYGFWLIKDTFDQQENGGKP